MTEVLQESLPQSVEKKWKADRENFAAMNQSRALLGRLKELLWAQQSRLDSYLEVLDKQYKAIENGGSEDILHYTEMEERIEREFFSIQKAFISLERLYRTTYAAETPLVDITAFKATLEARKTEVQMRSRRNQDLLAQRMALLRSQIQTLQASPLRRTSVYAQVGIPSCIDIWM
ncbi:MAG: flagellar biosynthesis protein FlgN [Treponema sp.]|jgi:hypothetical protein|nr:flagellar biosynthesis protein FlgN [Treponema sp.]